MAYPDDVLVTDERVLLHQHPHPKMLVGPALAFVLTAGAGGYLAALVSREPWRGIGWTAIVVLGLVLVAWFAVAPLARWSSTHFVVTTRRVLVREGVLTRVGFEIPMNRIDSVHFRQGVLERMFGCGTLSIESASGSEATPVEFDDIPGVEQVYAVLYDAAERRGRTQRG